MIQRPKPIADQVEELLLSKMQDREFTPGGRLPPENELAVKLGVSRTSVRAALAALEAKRLVFRRQGDGTYINRRLMELSTRIGEDWDFLDMITESGREVTVETVEICPREATKEEAEGLEIPLGETVLSIRRIFLADEQPAILSNNTLPTSLLQSEGPYDVAQPISGILKDYCQQEVSYTISDISAAIPPSEVYEHFRIPQNIPILRFTDIFYNKQNEALVYGVNYFYNQALRVRVARSWG